MKVELLIGFLADIIKRFIKPTPQFFKILQILSSIIFAITGLPEIIHSLCDNIGVCITMPIWWDSLHSTAMSYAAIFTILISQLTTKTEEKGDLVLKD
jgi:hypothetical protein